MSKPSIKVENLSKAYQLGQIGTGTISRDLERWFARIRGKEDPFLRIGEVNTQNTKSLNNVVWSLKDVSFEIQQGDAIGIIGKNGAGKSTLLKILSKITSPTSGKITGNGRIASLLEVGTGFHPELSGRENIYLNGAILGMRKKEIKRKLDEIVDFAGVERFLDTPVKRYSSGMYVRLAFAVAAHLESEILIVDEVLAVGDAEFQKKCLGKMGDISSSEGRTVLFVSHNMQSITRLCTRSILLESGFVKGFDKSSKIIDQYFNSTNKKQEIAFETGIVSFLKVYQENDTIQIECHYRDCGLFLFPSFGFIVSDIYNNKLFGTNPRFQNPTIKIKNSATGIFRVTVVQPLLLDGMYYLSAWLGDGHFDYFEHEQVLSFEVSNMTQFDSIVGAADIGPIVTNVEWEQIMMD